MTWLSLILAAVRLLGSLAGFLRDRKLISAGEANMVADALEAQANDVDKGRKARLAQRAANVKRLPDDPGPFQRD